METQDSRAENRQSAMTRSERRALMPTVASWIDSMRELYGDIRIDYAAEGGHEWGARQAQGVKVSDMVIEPKHD